MDCCDGDFCLLPDDDFFLEDDFSTVRKDAAFFSEEDVFAVRTGADFFLEDFDLFESCEAG
tara:strand:- start:76490 stop:76672 length:183 start_codon:yes stop_codon:yes gene_type:complete